MNKKLILVIVTASILLGGCGAKLTTTSVVKKSKPTTVSATNKTAIATVPSTQPVNTTTASTAPKSTSINSSQLVHKVWVLKGADYDVYTNSSFCIAKIVNGQITGTFGIELPDVPDQYQQGKLTGTIVNNTANCNFDDGKGDSGTVKLVFESSDSVQATFKFTNEDSVYKGLTLNGTFEFRPYSLSDMKDFQVDESQSFTVKLNSLGTVRFLSGIGTGGNHIPTLFYLTDMSGNVIFDFNAALPYNATVDSVSFQDVNKDGLLDIVTVVHPNGTSGYVASIYLQKADGIFVPDFQLDQEMNNSGNNTDIKTITKYIAQKF